MFYCTQLSLLRSYEKPVSCSLSLYCLGDSCGLCMLDTSPVNLKRQLCNASTFRTVILVFTSDAIYVLVV